MVLIAQRAKIWFMKTAPKPHFCQTASAYLIVTDKILLIKHKKLGAWMSPGGHLESGELPHEAAEREFFEETGIKVQALGLSDDLRFLPLPFKSGLHWVCEENYERRERDLPPLAQWARGCEQHFDLAYLVEAKNNLDFKKNLEETDGIAWFTLEEIENLDTFEDVRRSISMAFSYAKTRR